MEKFGEYVGLIIISINETQGGRETSQVRQPPPCAVNVSVMLMPKGRHLTMVSVIYGTGVQALGSDFACNRGVDVEKDLMDTRPALRIEAGSILVARIFEYLILDLGIQTVSHCCMKCRRLQIPS